MNLEKAGEALKKYFGYDHFRPMQAEIIQSVYDKKNSLILMPTGGGKSICYQIPAITMEGCCVVVSPLISLMKDQVEGLRANGIKAAYLNSSLNIQEQRAVEDDLFQNSIDLLYVSPEKLVTPNFFSLLQSSKINLFAIDEAHCISAWGHDFRPEYTQLKFLPKQFPHIPVIGLTATADKLTRKDIVDQLGITEGQTFLASFDRPNLSLSVRPGQKRIEQILEFIKIRPNQSGIVYCLSRKNTEQVAEKLQKKGIKAMCYHAGMPTSVRSKVQEDFINDNIPVVCATVAFGMGIDKSNVRWVIHYNLPKNLEGYYQEIGRAGRDGANADTLMFYSFRDVTVYRQMFQENGGDNVATKLAKLERMQQYADSLICRRKVLLNYFSENMQEDCGNCDVCKNPPNYLDGTVLAQKALSAVVRLREKVGIQMLIAVLRGSGRKEVFDAGYNKIKTYGAGREHSFNDWQHYIQQLINLGLLEIAYDQKNTLKLTPASKGVLFESKKVKLFKFVSLKEQKEKAKLQFKPKTQRQSLHEELFSVLQKLRRQLAQQNGLPPYLIFNDATLHEMSEKRPATDEDMLAISGVGERKLQRYGDRFMLEITEFVKSKMKSGVNIKGATYMLTLDLHKEGLSPEQIAEKREMGLGTIYNHLAHLYEKGAEVDIRGLLTDDKRDYVVSILPKLKMPYKLKDIFEACHEKVNYHEIKLALAHYFRVSATSDQT